MGRRLGRYKREPPKEYCLQAAKKIAICGKGGVGKTTVCAILAQLFAEEGFDVIAVDADSDTNLCSAFGLDPEQSPEPMIAMKELIGERTGTDKAAVGAYFRLNPKVSDLPEKHCLRLDGIGAGKNGAGTVKLFVLGSITQAGAGCACAEGAFLKALLSYTVLQSKEIIIVDLAAGVECMGRSSIKGLDVLIVVVEPGSRSLATAGHLAEMGRQLGVKHIAVIVNKVSDQEQIAAIEKQLNGLTILTAIDYNSEIQQGDLQRQNVYLSGGQAVSKLREAKAALDELE